MYEYLEVDVQGRVGRLWLNRPERLNALSNDLLEELIAAAQWFDAHNECSVVVIGGRGRAFCGGADLASLPPADDPNIRAIADTGRRMADALEGMRALTIARIHAWCVGGGVVLASACDLRIAERGTAFSIPEVNLGIPLAWGGIQRLVREVGAARTKELVITCREFGAQEAAEMGFLNRVVDADALDQVVDELAASVASKARSPVYATKRHANAVTAQMVGMDHTWADADGLVAALSDPECEAIRTAYIQEHLNATKAQ